MLLIESVKQITIKSTRASFYDCKPTLFAMIVDESTGYASEIEFADIAEAQGFVDAVNKLVKERA